MPRLRRCLGLFICCSVAIAARAAPATRPVDLEALVAQLSSNNGVERQRAQDELVEAGAQGPEVEARLNQLLRETHDEEATARAQAALRLIEENRVVGPTLITLHTHEADAKQVLADIARQAHYEIMVEPPELWSKKSTPKITLDAERRPFWEMLHEFCRQAGVEPNFGDAGRFKLIESGDNKWVNYPVVFSGPLMFQAVKVTETRSREFGQPAGAGTESTRELEFNVNAEPKLRVLRDASAATVTAASDENGLTLLPENEDDANAPAQNVTFTDSGDTSRAWEMTVDLAMPPKGGRRIARLQGAVRMAVPLKVETLEIGDVLSATEVTRTVGGRRLVFRKARKIKGGYEAIVTLYRGNLDDAQWQQWTNPKEDVRLLDAKGLVIRFTGVSEMETAERQSTLSLQFENPNNAPEGIVGPVGKPAKLAWDVPVTAREIRIPFEFRELPFP